ncbi:hypothetical protein [Streptomyces sp. LaBMicrA B280]|uniref:hypothetical protein n=1 Tax=Streptomyces sp. LaBMicrA B280 TaxID=3391001 RepID=UPI003BA44621
MGLNYGYDMYLRPRDVARALGDLAEPAPPDHRVPPPEVTLPGGDRLTLPFTSDFKSEPVDCSVRGTLDLDTSLMFGVDDVVREYVVSRAHGRLTEGGDVGNEPHVRVVGPGQGAVQRPHRRQRRGVLPVRHGRRRS